MTTPEPSPAEKTLKRVLAISKFNGLSVVIVAGLGALLSLLFGDLTGILVGTLAVVAGWMELRGRKKLQQRDPAGMAWLVRAELLLLGVILAYCGSRLGSFDPDTAMGNLTPDMEAPLRELGMERADILWAVRTAFYSTYITVSVVTLIYQGGTALYYRRKTPLVTEALTAPSLPTADH